MSACVERCGIVVGLTERRGETLARVRLEAAPACAGCGSRESCSAGEAKGQVVTVRLEAPVVTGAPIALILPESAIALAAALGYLLPALGLLLGAVLAGLLFSSDALAALGAVAGLAAGVLLARFLAGSSLGRRVTPSLCPPVHSANLPGDFS